MAGQELKATEKTFLKCNSVDEKNAVEESTDTQQTEQNIFSALPVATLSFTPKKVADEDFSSKGTKAKRKNRFKQEQSETETDDTGVYEDVSGGKSDTEPEKAGNSSDGDIPRLKDKKQRNTISEHSSSVDKLNEDNDNSALAFETDETSNPEADKKLSNKVKKDEKNAERANKRLQKAESKLPRQVVIHNEKQFVPEKEKVQRKLRFEKEIKPVNQNKFLKKGVKGAENIAVNAVSGVVHNQISKYEDDNQALKAAHGTEKIAESVLHTAKNALHTVNKNMKSEPYRKVSKLKFQKEQAEQKLSYHKKLLENPELSDDKKSAREAMKKAQQKQKQIKNAKKAEGSAKKASELARNAEKKIVQAIASNKWAILIITVFMLLFLLFGTMGVSMSSSLVDTGTQIIATSYMSDEEEIYAAEEYMLSLENKLSEYIADIPNMYADYDEYRFYTDEISHNPYSLISFLSAMDMRFEFDNKVRAEIDALFAKLYTLEIVSIHEVRSYTYTKVDENGNETLVTVEYDYYILEITLTANDFEEIVKEKLEALGVYDLYLAMLETKGNKPDLF